MTLLEPEEASSKGPPHDLMRWHQFLLLQHEGTNTFLHFARELYFAETQVYTACEPGALDQLLAQGWRHHGEEFFRYNMTVIEDIWHWILPLRINLARFQLSQSQKRIAKNNADLKISWSPYRADEEKEALFFKHAERFLENVPPSLSSFIHENAPCETLELSVRSSDNRLLASSFVGVGENSLSSVYAMFDPSEGKRSLGIYTFLLELEYSSHHQYAFLYPGYTTLHPSIYEYKKGFHGLEYFDWMGGWHPFAKEGWKQSFQKFG